jgi:uncharacterized protein (TIGR03437 family)
MSKLLPINVLALVALIPMGTFAQTNVVLSSGNNLNLETGKTGTSGGDLSWNGTALTPVSNATGIDLTSTLGSTYSGQTQFSQLAMEASTLISALSGFQSLLTNSAITPAVNDLIVVQDNSSNYALLLVTSLSGGSIGLEFETFKGSSSGGGTPPPSGPNITGVVNNYSYIPPGFPNSGIAPGTIMLIFGTGMSNPPPAVLALNSSASPGIPTTWAGATLTVTGSDGKNYTPGIYYATPTQIAAVLPSKTPAGSATITVSYNGGTSNAFQFQVVPYALGLNTYYGIGSGLILATDTSGSILTYTNSAKPGQIIVIYGSGLGADVADSDTVFTSTPHAVNTPLQIYFGDTPGKILYAGSSGYPGYDQFDVTIPENVELSCYVGVVAVAGTGANLTVSNYGSLAISASGGECNDSIFGISGSTVSTLTGQTTVRYGDLFVGQLIMPATAPATGTVTDNAGFASFTKETGAAYGSSSGSAFSIGSCSVTEVVSISGTIPKVVGLDAGKTISLMGPVGTYTLTESTFQKGDYFPGTLMNPYLPANAISSTGGAFTFTGTGGADVGSFTTTINLPNPLLAWTNQSAGATINRAQGVTVTWTGGTPGSYVIIMGNSSDQNTGANGSFTCITNQSALSFDVPDYVTGTLPAGTGTLSVENIASYGTFTATGLDFGISFGFNSIQINSTYQ